MTVWGIWGSVRVTCCELKGLANSRLPSYLVISPWPRTRTFLAYPVPRSPAPQLLELAGGRCGADVARGADLKDVRYIATDLMSCRPDGQRRFQRHLEVLLPSG